MFFLLCFSQEDMDQPGPAVRLVSGASKGKIDACMSSRRSLNQVMVLRIERYGKPFILILICVMLQAHQKGMSEEA